LFLKMKKGLVAAVLFACALFALVGAEDATETQSVVVTLTKDNFDEVIKSHKLTLVKFFATWCMHCRALAPDYIKAAEILARDGEDFVLAEIDAEEYSEIAERYKVKGFPTLILFTNDDVEDYEVFNGERDVYSLVSFMRVRLGVAVKKINNDEELDKFFKMIAETLFVAYTDKESELAKVFTIAAEEMRGDFLFAIAPPTDKYTDKIVAYRDFEKEDREEVLEPKSVPTAAEIKQWFSIVSLPLAGEITMRNHKRYKVLPTLVVFTHVDAVHDPSGRRYVLNRLRPIAKEFHFRMLFAVQERNESDIYTFMKFPKDQKYAFAVLDNTKYYRSTETVVSKDTIRAVANQFFAGSLPRFVRSQPVPWFNFEGEVHTIVGTTFEGLITNTTTDTLLEIFAPWCGHCKAFKPEYDQLASEMNVKGSTVRIAKIDGTSNGVPDEYRYEGFPTLFWVPAYEGTHPTLYEGEHNLAAVKKFIEKHRSEDSQPYKMAPSRFLVQFVGLGVGGTLLGLVVALVIMCTCSKKVTTPKDGPKPVKKDGEKPKKKGKKEKEN